MGFHLQIRDPIAHQVREQRSRPIVSIAIAASLLLALFGVDALLSKGRFGSMIAAGAVGGYDATRSVLARIVW